MDTQTEANPAAVEEAIVSTPEAGATPDQTTDLQTGDGSEPLLEEIANPEDDTEEVDWEDGNKYRVPKALKPALMKEKDYRHKTMELAEQRKSIEAVEAELRQAQQVSQAEFQAQVQLTVLNDQVTQYEQIDWDAWTDADPFEAQKGWQKYQTALNKRNQISSDLNAHLQQKAHMSQQETAKRRDAILSTVAKEIPNWNPELQNTLESFAEANGYTRDELAAAAEPRDYKLLRLAHIGHQFVERQKAAAQMKAAGSAKAVPMVGGNAPAGAGDPANMSLEEYRAWKATQ